MMDGATSIHDRVGEKLGLAQTYAEDGAFFTAAKIVQDAAKMLQEHAEDCYPQTRPSDRDKITKRFRQQSELAEAIIASAARALSADLLAAAKIGLEYMQTEHECMLESCCLLDPDTHAPIRETLNDAERQAVEEIEGHIAQVKAAIERAEGK